MEKIELKIPNLGEAESTEIIEVNIKPGVEVRNNDPLIVLESEKAAMEIPSDHEGVIKDVLIKEGDIVKEGMVFAYMEADRAQKKNDDIEKDKTVQEKPISSETDYTEQKVFSHQGINAGPAVRKYARELEIDLSKIVPTGRNNKVTKDDLKKFIHGNKNEGIHYFKESDLAKFGKYTLKKQSKIRALGAKNLLKSWITIPHVTHYDEIDLTSISIKRKTQKVSILSYVIQGLGQALTKFPIFNSSLVEGDQILHREYINIGIAVDTQEGLVVPVIKDANLMELASLDTAVLELASKARSKKLRNNDLEGSTFTVSSLGKLGGLGFTPIINPPEVAILAVSNMQRKLVLLNDEAEERLFLPISMSYDHRVINGGDAGRFMVYLKDILES
jgi:pyruvate dehydrogenase E2 component (dihydrolipoamide acetyltransferase)